ncbi:ATP-dependent protease ATP-binding subunit [Gimesia maris DSM 8797]|nr:ATP-dependent protease ATP-binding subunit [Gimesia maris DSM 8797]
MSDLKVDHKIEPFRMQCKRSADLTGNFPSGSNSKSQLSEFLNHAILPCQVKSVKSQVTLYLR